MEVLKKVSKEDLNLEECFSLNPSIRYQKDLFHRQILEMIDTSQDLLKLLEKIHIRQNFDQDFY